jgi:hypothetical protein
MSGLKRRGAQRAETTQELVEEVKFVDPRHHVSSLFNQLIKFSRKSWGSLTGCI